MVTEIIRYESPPDVVDDFLNAYREAVQHLMADPHSLGVEIIRTKWDSIEGHEVHFTEGPHVEPFISHLRPYLQRIVEMAHYDSLYCENDRSLVGADYDRSEG